MSRPEQQQLKLSAFELNIILTPHEYRKLVALAEWRTFESKGRRHWTPIDCIRDFIGRAMPGGIGWTHPADQPVTVAPTGVDLSKAKAKL